MWLFLDIESQYPIPDVAFLFLISHQPWSLGQHSSVLDSKPTSSCISISLDTISALHACIFLFVLRWIALQLHWTTA
jgi:hypothetical protein